jgi:N-acetylmuramoyl-L-alanine amidase
MGDTYTVKQGDFLAKIAAKFGFTNPMTIWDDPKNSKLKQARKNPNVLFPGDELFIPDKKQKQEAASTEQKVRFELKSGKLNLRLILENAFGKPLANAECELTIDSTTHKLISDPTGKIETPIPATCTQGTLVVKDGTTPGNDQVIPIMIGHLDPIDTVTGQKARLNNLGYVAGPLDKDDQTLFQSAIEEFQCEHMGKSEVDGDCGPKTQAKLLSVHGC